MKVQTTKKKSETNQERKFEEKTLNALSLRVYESGFASLSIKVNEGTLVVNGHIREGKDGAFFAFPSYKGNDGKYYSQAYIIGEDLRTDLDLLVKQIID